MSISRRHPVDVAFVVFGLWFITKEFAMRRGGIPDMAVLVFGDWDTVVSARQYRDQLLDQRPFDEETSDFSQYRIACETAGDMVAAFTEFQGRLKLRCEFGFLMKSDDRKIQVDLITGFDGDKKPQCFVTVEESISEIAQAAKKAIEILQAAID